MSCLTSTARDVFFRGKWIFCRRWWVWATLWGLFMVAILAGLAGHEWPDGGQPLFDGGADFQSDGGADFQSDGGADFQSADCPLAPGDKLREPLVLMREGLYRLDIALTRQGTVSGRVVLRLTSDERGRNEIASAAVPAEAAEDVSRTMRRPYGFVGFRFSPVEGPGEGQVWLWLEAEADGPLGVRSLVDSEAESQIALKTYYRRSVGRNLTLFLGRLTDKPVGILNSPWSYGVLLALYAALLVALGWYVGCG